METAPKCARLRDFPYSSLRFTNQPSRLHFLAKYIPKYLTFGFQFCIFVVLLLTADSPPPCHPERSLNPPYEGGELRSAPLNVLATAYHTPLPLPRGDTIYIYTPTKKLTTHNSKLKKLWLET